MAMIKAAGSEGHRMMGWINTGIFIRDVLLHEHTLTDTHPAHTHADTIHIGL